MTPVDRLIQKWRTLKVRRWIPAGVRLLDIGCDDGALFRHITDFTEGVGIDPFIERTEQQGNVALIKGRFPHDLPDRRPFGAITMLAVLEHIPPGEQSAIAESCAACLVAGGRLLITVPSPSVDRILSILMFLRVIDGMSVEQHYGFHAASTPQIFLPAGFRLVHSEAFQLGLNNLFVFEKRGPTQGS